MSSMDKDQALQALIILFNCHNWHGKEEEREAKLDAYWLALEELAPTEIVSVCRKAMHGEIGNPDFLPSAAMLYQAARPTPPGSKKPSPFKRSGQTRLLSSTGNLFVTEGGITTVYSPEELAEWSYADSVGQRAMTVRDDG